jgi:hypothetical protein
VWVVPVVRWVVVVVVLRVVMVGRRAWWVPAVRVVPGWRGSMLVGVVLVVVVVWSLVVVGRVGPGLMRR